MKQFSLLLRTKKYFGLLITVVTIVIFWKFFINNSQYLTTIRHISPKVFFGILLMNLGVLICLIINNQLALQLLGKKMSTSDQFFLTAYSSIANFFGPLQSGPGVRGLYLKTKLGVKIKNYLFITLIQLGLLVLVSLIFLFGGYLSWWLTLLITLIGCLLSALIAIWLVKARSKFFSGVALRPKAPVMFKMLITTFALVIFVAGYYFIELRAIDAGISWRQAISYTGAANFGLFFSLTPDAIGIRESLLKLAHHLHHVSGGVIISANLIDRIVYALFLLILFLIVIFLQGRRKFNLVRQNQKNENL